MAFVDELSHDYERLHTAKEDAFWAAYMGLRADADAARAELDRREVELKRWIQDPARLERAREELARAEGAGASDEDLTALRGWVRTLQANVIESPEASRLAERVIELEGKLARARGTMKLGYQVPGEAFTDASSVRIAVMIATDKDEARRKAAWEGLRSIEGHVLAHGFLDVVAERNRLGRMCGGEDYYDWKVKQSEGLSKAEIFALLDDLERQTRDAARRALDELRAAHGPDATKPWNLRYFGAGDVTAEQDPYFPFSLALERWGRSFAALGIDYNGAELVLDLVDRKGKHENGFMHGPVPAWRDHGTYRPARIQFTANAIPGMVGAGKRATETLFHEGGHAAHFANIDMPAPCFAQEFAPTSVAFAEVQSMFLDSLLSDADWQTRYARTVDGEPMPFELVEKGIRAQQRLEAITLRAMLAVCYAERAIYEIPEGERTAERVLREIRAVEQRMLFEDEGSGRPTLSVPHLLAGEGSAYYHGYVLALMGVQQTREFFLARDGHLMDNPRIGPDLRRAYWQPGNSLRFFDFIERLTGEKLTADALAAHANRSVDEAVAEAKELVAKAAAVPAYDRPIALGGTVRLVHGNEEIAAADGDGFGDAAATYRDWIATLT